MGIVYLVLFTNLYSLVKTLIQYQIQGQLKPERSLQKDRQERTTETKSFSDKIYEKIQGRVDRPFHDFLRSLDLGQLLEHLLGFLSRKWPTRNSTDVGTLLMSVHTFELVADTLLNPFCLYGQFNLDLKIGYF